MTNLAAGGLCGLRGRSYNGSQIEACPAFKASRFISQSGAAATNHIFNP